MHKVEWNGFLVLGVLCGLLILNAALLQRFPLLLSICAILFTVIFLDLENRAVLLTIIVFPAAIGVSAALMNATLALFLIALGIQAIVRGYRPAVWFTLAWVFLLIPNMGLIGATGAAVLLSLAFADRARFIQKEREAAQAVLIQQQTQSLRNQTRVARSFSRFVPKEFLQILNRENIVDVQLGDHVQRTMIVLFSGVPSFTTLCERMSPQESFDLVNSYLARISPLIGRFGGFIDKYACDAILAFFPEDADRALCAAVAIQEAMRSYNAERKLYHHEQICTGIGMHAGRMLLGTVGGADRMETTVISDVVTTARRLEGLTRIYGSQVIVSGQILARLHEPQRHGFRFLDTLRAENSLEPVEVYGIL